MKKNIILMLISTMLLFLCSCKAFTEVNVTESYTYNGNEHNSISYPTDPPESLSVIENDTVTAEDITSATGEKQTEKVEYSSKGIPIENTYFSLYLPVSWDGKYISNISLENDTISVKFREISSVNAGLDGILFTIVLVPSGGTNEFAGTKELHTLYTGEGSFKLYCILPTDVQYNESTAAVYSSMVNDIPGIMETLSPAADCVFE